MIGKYSGEMMNHFPSNKKSSISIINSFVVFFRLCLSMYVCMSGGVCGIGAIANVIIANCRFLIWMGFQWVEAWRSVMFIQPSGWLLSWRWRGWRRRGSPRMSPGMQRKFNGNEAAAALIISTSKYKTREKKETTRMKNQIYNRIRK